MTGPCGMALRARLCHYGPLQVSPNRSEGIARTGYLIPGRDGIPGLDLAGSSSAAVALRSWTYAPTSYVLTSYVPTSYVLTSYVPTSYMPTSYVPTGYVLTSYVLTSSPQPIHKHVVMKLH